MFVFRNNIYYKHKADSPTSYQITTDGVPKAVFNGVPDWVYEGKVHLIIGVSTFQMIIRLCPVVMLIKYVFSGTTLLGGLGGVPPPKS